MQQYEKSSIAGISLINSQNQNKPGNVDSLHVCTMGVQKYKGDYRRSCPNKWGAVCTIL